MVFEMLVKFDRINSIMISVHLPPFVIKARTKISQDKYPTLSPYSLSQATFLSLSLSQYSSPRSNSMVNLKSLPILDSVPIGPLGDDVDAALSLFPTN